MDRARLLCLSTPPPAYERGAYREGEEAAEEDDAREVQLCPSVHRVLDLGTAVQDELHAAQKQKTTFECDCQGREGPNEEGYIRLRRPNSRVPPMAERASLEGLPSKRTHTPIGGRHRARLTASLPDDIASPCRGASFS